MYYLCRMKTLMTYYGGKQTMLCHIVPLLPVHHLYCESFFVGVAVFFAKHPSRIEVMNEKDGFVINFYRLENETLFQPMSNTFQVFFQALWHVQNEILKSEKPNFNFTSLLTLLENVTFPVYVLLIMVLFF